MVINKVKGAYQEGKSLHCITLSFVLSSAFALSGCASTSGDKTATTGLNPPAEAQSNPADPYEGFNRKVFAFNDKVDNYVAEPISNAYKWATPQFMQTGVTNFFNNLKNINVVLNDLMQAKFKQSAEDTGRLLINTTAGVGGLFDVAKYAGLEQNDEDFEQTLAVWGVPQGSYLVIPFIGPSTARGIPGTVFDTAANPATYVGMPVQVVSMLNSRANAEGALKFIDEASLDPYVFTRESFLQWRQNLATDGKSEATNDLADFEKDLLGVDKSEKSDAEEDSLIEPESTKSSADIFTYLSKKEIDRIIKNLFNSDSEDFANTVEKMSLCKNYEEASAILDNIFKYARIKPHSRDAASLTNAVAKYFNTEK